MSRIDSSRGSKRQIMNADNEIEKTGLKAFYQKLAGDSPALDVNANPTEAELWAAIAEVAHAPLTTVTYAELTSLIDDESLIAGAKYLITDYQTVHTIPNTEDVNTADVEPLVVTALSTNKLEPVAFSPAFPQDVIYYNVVNDETMVAGCTKGYISRRVDTKQNNDFPFDFRNVKFRRWQIEVTTQDTDGNDANYTKGQIVKKTGTNELYFKLNDETNKFFIDQSSWCRFEWDNLNYVSPNDSEWFVVDDSFTLVIPCSSLYQDYYFFSSQSHYSSAYSNKAVSPLNNLITNSNTVVFGVNFSNNSIGANFNYNSIGANFSNNSIGDNFNNNSIGANFYNNSIGANFNYNSIGDNFNNNSIGSYFNNNSIGANSYNISIGDNFNNNSIGDNFYSNSIGANFNYNSIGANFIYNSIGDNFYSNSIGSYFNFNSIGANFYSNSIGDNFYSNSIDANFSSNSIGDNFKNNSGTCSEVEFADSTHVYATYHCQLFMNNLSAPKLIYLNDVVLTVVDADA